MFSIFSAERQLGTPTPSQKLVLYSMRIPGGLVEETNRLVDLDNATVEILHAFMCRDGNRLKLTIRRALITQLKRAERRMRTGEALGVEIVNLWHGQLAVRGLYAEPDRVGVTNGYVISITVNQHGMVKGYWLIPCDEYEDESVQGLLRARRAWQAVGAGGKNAI